MTRSVKISLAMIGAAVLVLVGFLVFGQEGDDATTAGVGDSGSASELLVRNDSARLSEGNEAVFVEFLDFECEACIALYPTIENLRADYGDRVTFFVRHMPLHSNSMDAALAAEAAAEQGEFEGMYQRLFENADQWGHKQTSQQEAFFDYAEDLDLDMDRFTTAYDDPATVERVEQSDRDARALGVSGTPTFFLNGERLQPQNVADLEEALDAALDD